MQEYSVKDVVKIRVVLILAMGSGYNGSEKVVGLELGSEETEEHK